MGSTDELYLDDAYLTSFDATVLDVGEMGVVLDRTAFYATSGGQPHDRGRLRGASGDLEVTNVRKRDGALWHEFSGPSPALGATVHGEIDWERRHQLMRVHTSLHILCGVIWNEWGVSVTGGNMEPLTARMDFEFDPLPEGFASTVQALVNQEIAADRPIEVSYLPRAEALADDALVRTKVSLIPAAVDPIRIVDIVGLDKQADGGTHVRSTGEVGRFEVTKTESKGKGNKRVRIALHDT